MALQIFGFFLELLGQLHTIECVRQFGLFVGYLADIVQQSGTFGFLRVQSQFRCHDGAKVGCFAGVLQQVLSVG